MSTEQQKPDVRRAFEAAEKGVDEAKSWSEVDARTALESAVKALDDVDQQGHLSAEGKNALNLCRKALHNVPENIKAHAPQPVLRPGGKMSQAADRVDRKVREKRDARKARRRTRRQRKSEDKER